MRQELVIETRDGAAKTSVFRSDKSDKSSAKGILFYMDATGPRSSLYNMAQRLADQDYTVLLPDIFYRFGNYGPFTGASFSDPSARTEILGMLEATTHEMTRRDNEAFLSTLSKLGAVGPIASVGYCVGGGRAVALAADFPETVIGAASFHGGNLASSASDSPHRKVNRIKGRIYVGAAGVDSSFPPEQSAKLAEALRVGGVDHIIENYVGMGHGWTVADHSTYDKRGAERHWKRLTEFLAESFSAA